MKDPLAQLSFEDAGEVLVVHVEGEIESSNSDELRGALAGRLTNYTAGLVLDLTRATYLDSSGIELLFDLARRLRTHRQAMRLVVPPEAPMRRVLELCDIDEAAPVDLTVDESLTALAAA
jgi:anti-anti-sigma factor